MVMQLDCHQRAMRPLTTTTTTNSNKRARSPEPAFDRPNKRPTLLTTTSIPFFGAGRSHSPEDWVSQTDGLRLESPMAMGLGPQVVLQSNGDEDTAMQDDEPIYSGGASHPLPHQFQPQHFPGHLPTLSIPHQDSQSYLSVNNHDTYSASPRSASPNQYLSGDPSALHPHPAIRFTPATPLELTPPAPCEAALPEFQPHHPQTPPISGMDAGDAMMMSPARTASFNGCIDSPVSPRAGMMRRQKFTMGPRSDCEKCRMGAKGHSVHFS